MTVKYEKKGRIAIITINRPEAMNALDNQTYSKLKEALADFRNNPELWVGIITGAGDKAFSAGADLSTDWSNGDSRDTNTDVDSWKLDDKMYKPLIAAVNGYCLGWGLEVALICDIRIAAEHASFGLPEVTRGLVAWGGGAALLPKILTRCHASEILLTGKRISSQEAYRMGLVNKVVPIEQLMPTAIEWAETICLAAPLAVRATKEIIIRGSDMTAQESLELSAELAEKVQSTEDYKEGTRAFIERRKPEFKGR